jgi:hypothetical protein
MTAKTYDEFSVLEQNSNDTNNVFQETLNRSIVVFDEKKVGALYIQAHLEKRFPIPNFRWIPY